MKNAGAARVWLHNQETKLAPRFVQDPVVQEKIQQAITTASTAKAEELHNRLKFHVQRLTCHIKRDEAAFIKEMNQLTPANVKVLAHVLYKELCSVIKAVEEAE